MTKEGTPQDPNAEPQPSGQAPDPQGRGAPVATGEGGTPEAPTGDGEHALFGGKEIPTELEPFAKGMQATFTKAMQGVSSKVEELVNKRLAEIEEGSKPKDSEKEGAWQDPLALIDEVDRRREERRRQEAELSELSPEEREERERERERELRLKRIEARQASRDAGDAFAQMSEKNPVLASLEKQVAAKIEADRDIGQMAVRDPRRAINMAYQEVLDDLGTTEAALFSSLKKDGEPEGDPSPQPSPEEIQKQKEIAMRPPASAPNTEPRPAPTYEDEIDKVLKEQGATWEDVSFAEA